MTIAANLLSKTKGWKNTAQSCDVFSSLQISDQHGRLAPWRNGCYGV